MIINLIWRVALRHIIKGAVASLCGLSLWAAPVTASDNLFVQYYALLSDVDLANSSGAPLGNTCAILQQDRANVHRFGRAHDLDQLEPVFTNATMRTRLGNLCRESGGFPFVMDQIARSGSIYVWIGVYQEQGQLTRVVVRQGAG